MYGHPGAKKPKVLKQLPDASLETMTPMSGPIPLPVASQMSNMSNPNKLMKMIAGRDRGRKAKPLKVISQLMFFSEFVFIYFILFLFFLIDVWRTWIV